MLPSENQAAGNHLCRGSRSGDEFVMLDLRRNPHVAVGAWFDAHDLALTADVHVARLADLLRKSDHEFNGAADVEMCFGEEVKSAVADVPGMRHEFRPASLARQDAHGQAHCERAGQRCGM